MTEDPAADALATLSELFAEGREALADGDVDAARETVASAEGLTADELPEGDLRARLLHGCGRVRRLLDPETGDDEEGVETEAAVEYLAAMERRLPVEE